MGAYIRMLATLVKAGALAVDYAVSFRKLRTEPERGRWIADRAQRLGPTFVKMAQFVANRRDIVGPDIAQALRRLQDRVQPMPAHEVQRLLSRNPALAGVLLSSEPFASASIAQVHLGRRLSDPADAPRLAVKLRRPGIRRQLDADLGGLRALLVVARRLGLPDVDEQLMLLDDFGAFVLLETDFRNEVANLEAFARVHADDPQVRVPRVVPELCSDEVVVMEYVAARRIDDGTDLSPAQRKAVAALVMDQVVKQFMVHGIMHGDPHAGNIGLLLPAGGAPPAIAIVYYDLGHVVRVDRRVQAAIKTLVFELMLENVAGVRRLLQNWPDLLHIKDAERTDAYIDMYIRYLKTIDFNAFRSSSADAAAAPTTADEIVPIRMNGKLLEIIRVFGLVEGLCLVLDDDFNYADVFVKNAESFLMDADFLRYKASADLESLWDPLE